MSVRLSLRETRETGTFVKLQHILILFNILYILCIIILLGNILHQFFDFGNHISITYQNSPKSVFSLFLWVQVFGLV